VVGIRVDHTTLSPFDLLTVGTRDRTGLDVTYTPFFVPLAGNTVLTVSSAAKHVFTASVVASGWCESVCMHGDCDTVQCICHHGWVGMDCSTPILPLPEGQDLDIGRVGPGHNAYFVIRPQRSLTALLSFRGRGDATALVLVGHNGTMPTNHPDSLAEWDHSPWLTRSSPDQLLRLALVAGGTYYVRVYNPSWRTEHTADGVLTLGEDGVDCPFACYGRGACSTGDGVASCTCDYGRVGEYCHHHVEYAVLAASGLVQSDWTLQPGQWSYLVLGAPVPDEIVVYTELLAGDGHYLCAANEGRALPHLRPGYPPSIHAVVAEYRDGHGAEHGRGAYQELHISRAQTVTIGIGSFWGASDLFDRWSGGNLSVRLSVRPRTGARCRRGVAGVACSGHPCVDGTWCDCPENWTGPACSTATRELSTGESGLTLGGGQYRHHRLPQGLHALRVRWSGGRLRVGLERLRTSTGRPSARWEGGVYPEPVADGSEWGTVVYIDGAEWQAIVYNSAPDPVAYTVSIVPGAPAACGTGWMLDACDGVGPSPPGTPVDLAPREWGYWLLPNGDPGAHLAIECTGVRDCVVAMDRVPAGPSLLVNGFLGTAHADGVARVTLTSCRPDDRSCVEEYSGGSVYGLGEGGTVGVAIVAARGGVNGSRVVVRRVDAGGTRCAAGFSGPACAHLCPGWTGVDGVHTFSAPSAPALECGGHGTCGRGSCDCWDGWQGATCHDAVPTLSTRFERAIQLICAGVGLLLVAGGCGLCVQDRVRRKRAVYIRTGT
jgi:hypothetical protein